MYKELLVLKAEAEHDMLYAQAKLEVVGKLLAKFNEATVVSTSEVETPVEEALDDDNELEGV